MSDDADNLKIADPHALDTKEIIRMLDVDPAKGLDSESVENRRKKYGANVLPQKQKTSVVKLIIKQFKDFLILILFIAAAIAFIAGQVVDTYIILAVIVFNAVVGFVQEFRAEKAVQAIMQMVTHEVTVLRNGKQKTVGADQVVLGDILLLEEGQSVSADARILEQKNLRTAEAALTGESEPIDKKPEVLEKETDLGDRINMVWKGTNVVKGTAKAVVTSIGADTEIGKIATSLQGMESTESNFKKKTSVLAKKMAVISFISAIAVFLIGYFYRDFEFNEILLVTIATLVSAIPEGLPVVISIVLAIGAGRMAKHNAIIREFTATEVMGSVTTILTDKTGTITQNILSIRRVFGADEKEYEVSGEGYQVEGKIQLDEKEVDIKEASKILEKILLIARYGVKAELDSSKKETAGDEDDENSESGVTGDPTEIALRVLGEKSKIEDHAGFQEIKELDDVPFNSELKFRARLVEVEGGDRLMLVVGAPERILELSTEVLTENGAETLDDKVKEIINNKYDEWAGEAYRVLALAYKPTEGTSDISEEDVKDLVWTGCVGMIDPPRQGVKEAIEDCNRAGIRVVMLTGDHAKTAGAIARQVGILKQHKEGERGDYPEALSEKDVAKMDDNKLDEMLKHVSVFARVTPNTKLRVAERLQHSGELIAMTGDGVNDAPALQKADVGIAMGKKGTDVARDAAKIVLSDDNFASIVHAIRQGRIVFRNVKLTSYFLLTTTFAATLTIVISLLIGLPLPLTAVQILWVNMVTNGVIDVALATEPGHGDMMDRKPIKKDENILKWSVMPNLLLMSVVMIILTLIVFNYYLPEGEEVARTGAFFAITATQLFNVFNMRNLRLSVFTIGVFGNKWINLALVAALIMQVGVVKIIWLQGIFGFGDIPYLHFGVIVLMASSVLWIGELYKWILRKRSKNKKQQDEND